MPRISAPIDDHLLLPPRPRPLWEKVLRVGLLIGRAFAAMGAIVSRASLLR